MNTAAHTEVQVLISAEAACFRRPEFVDDLITYDAPPPPTINRLLSERLPRGSRWELHHITVVKPIDRKWLELEGAAGRKRVLALIDVAYIVAVRWWAGEQASAQERAVTDLFATSPPLYLGLREFAATLDVVVDTVPTSALPEDSIVDLGWMPYELKGVAHPRTRYFNPIMKGGTIDLSPGAIGVLAA